MNKNLPTAAMNKEYMVYYKPENWKFSQPMQVQRIACFCYSLRKEENQQGRKKVLTVSQLADYHTAMIKKERRF